MRPDNTKWVVLIVVGAIVGAVIGPMLGRSLSGGTAMIVFGLILLGVIALIAWSLSANKVGKPATAAMMADARTLVPAAGMARIYVLRRGFMGGLAGMKVAVLGSGSDISVASGQVRMNQYVMAEVPPGTYTIETAMARNGTKPSTSQTTHTLGAGEAIVMLVQLQLEALHAQTMQQRIIGAEAQREIGKAKMVQWTNRSGAMA